MSQKIFQLITPLVAIVAHIVALIQFQLDPKIKSLLPLRWESQFGEGLNVEPLAVGFHAANQARAKLGESAVVLGSRCIGLVTLMALKAMGVTTVYVIDIISKRLNMAEQLGASRMFKGDELNIVQAIMGTYARTRSRYGH